MLRARPAVTDVATTLWRHQSPRGRIVECAVRFVPTGVQVEVISGCTPLYSRIFANGKDALAWVEEERSLRLTLRRG
jgi:hypothetical protein